MAFNNAKMNLSEQRARTLQDEEVLRRVQNALLEASSHECRGFRHFSSFWESDRGIHGQLETESRFPAGLPKIPNPALRALMILPR